MFGLPSCLQIAIAASSIESLTQYVGNVAKEIKGRNDVVQALLVEPHYQFQPTPGVPLWSLVNAHELTSRLHPKYQVWVHLDYSGYRQAWSQFGMPPPGKDFLDHVANRKAMRLRGSTHPYLRLCPVSHRVNTSGGGPHGGEGMERKFMAELQNYSLAIQDVVREAPQVPILLADPMDLTKMINFPPGTMTLDGVRDTQQLFYPA